MARWIVMLSAFSLGVVALGGAVAPAAAADVRVGINFGIPAPVVVAPPAPVYVAPPAPVYVPPAPVYVAPPVAIAPGYPVYYYGASYYTFYRNAWFIGPGYGGPWRHVAYGRVPRPIIVSPHSHLVAGRGNWGHGHGGHRH